MQVADHIAQLTHCDLCGQPLERTGHVVVRGEQRLLGTPHALTTVACRYCRFVFQGQRFSNELLAALYAHDASFAFGENDGNRSVIRKHLAERQQVISDALALHGLTRGARVLDVGGGIGECCAHLAGDHEVVVADASHSAPADPRMRKVDGLFSDQLAPASFDVAVLNHVLEHVFSPTELLASTWRVLRPGSIVVIEVPFELYTPLLARRLGDWRHVAYFSRAVMRQFLHRAGFTVDRLHLVNGCYDVRRLPVIRALACKRGAALDARGIERQSALTLLSDMLSPAALGSLARRALRGRA